MDSLFIMVTTVSILLISDAIRHLKKNLKIAGDWSIDKNKLIENLGIGFIGIIFTLFWNGSWMLSFFVPLVLGYALIKSLFKV